MPAISARIWLEATTLLVGVAATLLVAGGTVGAVIVLQTSGPTAADNENPSPATPASIRAFEVVEVSTLGEAKLPDGIRPQSIAVAPDGSLIIADYYKGKSTNVTPRD